MRRTNRAIEPRYVGAKGEVIRDAKYREWYQATHGIPLPVEPTAPRGSHLCHWPGCKTEVPPKLWGCKDHWFQLPKFIRDRIWANYRPGQERDKNPSPGYVEAARDARRWIVEYGNNAERVKS